jgi:DNA topoisomerase-1
MGNDGSGLPEVPPHDPVEAARFAGLRYVTDSQPGIRRSRRGRGFGYTSPTGERITDPDTLAWIRSIAIPPAWTNVWISPVRNGHILATGRDARARKQYRYHPRWRAVRDDTKYGHLLAFGELLPQIRARVEADLAGPGLTREKVLAAIVRLLELTFIRVGNEEYARLNRSFGLTTLRSRHVRVEGTHLRFRFRGKSGVAHEVGLRDRRLARLIRRIQELPGQELFEYVNGDGVQRVTSEDVNAYLREACGEDVTAKDFRTWAGTVLAFRALRDVPAVTSEAEAKRAVATAIRGVAERLGNTPAVCRKAYVHPGVVDAYLEGALRPAPGSAAAEDAATTDALRPPTAGEEAAVLDLLRARLAATARQASAA